MSSRIFRHNEIYIYLALEELALEAHLPVARAQMFMGDNGILKIDLVIKTLGKTLIVDFTVRFKWVTL